MADNKKLSELPVTTTPALTDRAALLTDPAGSPDDQTCALSTLATLILAQGAGRLLNVTAYNPGSSVSTQTSSNTDADLDATNLTITFVVPPSGAVLVRLTAVAVVDNAAAALRWGLRTTGGVNVARGIVTSNTDQLRCSIVFAVSGLTPGASQTYRWGVGVTSNNGFTRYGDAGTTVNLWGPAVMEVWAA